MLCHYGYFVKHQVLTLGRLNKPFARLNIIADRSKAHRPDASSIANVSFRIRMWSPVLGSFAHPDAEYYFHNGGGFLLFPASSLLLRQPLFLFFLGPPFVYLIHTVIPSLKYLASLPTWDKGGWAISMAAQ